MSHLRELVGWWIRLWLVRVLDDRKNALGHAVWGVRNAVDSPRNVGWERFVSRFSPWVSGQIGYKRRRLRRLAYILRFPIQFGRLTLDNWIVDRLKSITPYAGPGRYEGMNDDDALKAEWFDYHREFAAFETGNSSDFNHAALFDLVPPWSRDEEVWLVTTDSRGFVDATQRNARERFADLEREYNAQLDDEPGLGDGWREGQPEFNGAFR